MIKTNHNDNKDFINGQYTGCQLNITIERRPKDRLWSLKAILRRRFQKIKLQ